MIAIGEELARNPTCQDQSNPGFDGSGEVPRQNHGQGAGHGAGAAYDTTGGGGGAKLLDEQHRLRPQPTETARRAAKLTVRTRRLSVMGDLLARQFRKDTRPVHPLDIQPYGFGASRLNGRLRKSRRIDAIPGRA